MFDDERFSHYLSYGATDQQTVRALAGSFDGLVVPGTVAAFQREGTGGFVHTLSATSAAPPYVIDPRFPLFQQSLVQPKRAHLALAELLNAPELVQPSRAPAPSDFSDELVERTTDAWLKFNSGYSTQQLGKFAKYADRLGEPVVPENVHPPLAVIPPYLVASARNDGWWQLSRRFEPAARRLAPSTDVVSLVASDSAIVLSELLDDLDEERAIVWVSRLQELEAGPAELVAYMQAVRNARRRGRSLFALYGGFFSVLLAGMGLSGSSHGIGYGEFRDWIELPRSGPPPARYYLPIAHRYVQQELAYQLWLGNRELLECTCPECEGLPPIALDYHALMRHSVLCRSREIQEWGTRPASENAHQLARDAVAFSEAVESMTLPAYIRQQSEKAIAHVSTWVTALSD